MHDLLIAAAAAAIGVVGSQAAMRVLRKTAAVPAISPTLAMPAASFDEQPETWELINDEARHLLSAQRSAGERVETKAALVMAAALTAAQFVAKEPLSSYWLPFAVVGYATAFGIGMLCIRPRAFEELGLKRVMLGVWWWPRGRAAAEMANSRNEAIRVNALRHRRRVSFFWWSLAALAIGAMMSIGHLTRGERTDDDGRLNGTCVAATPPSTFICTARP